MAPRSVLHLVAYVTLLSLLSAPNVKAENSAYLEMSLEELSEIPVASASKLGLKESSSPATTTIISRSDILHYGYRTLGEALSQLPGVYTSSDRNYDNVGFRGIARPGDYNSRVLIMIDGHRLNDPVYDYAGIGEDFPLDLSDVERIEVTKGAVSSVWGTNALLAVVNVITRKGKEINGAEVSASAGNRKLAKGTAHVGQQYQNGLELAAGLSGLSTSGNDSLYFEEFNQVGVSDGIAHDLDGERSRHAYFSAAYQDFNFLFAKGFRRKEIPTASFDSLFNVEGAYSADESDRIEIGYKKTINSSGIDSVNARIFYDDAFFRSAQPYADDIGPFLSNSKSVGQTIGTEVSAISHVSNFLNLAYGLDARRLFNMKFDIYSSAPSYELFEHSNNSSSQASLFGEADFKISDSLHAITGVRFDHYSTVGSTWSPRGALVYSITPSLTAKIMASEAFRAPNNYELNYTDNLSYVANPDLDSEKLKNFEFGLEQNFGKSKLAMNIYHLRLSGIIDFVVRDDGFFQYQNGATNTSNGAEIAYSGAIAESLQGFASLSISNATDDDTDAHLSNSPRRMVALGATYELIPKDLTLSARIQYLSERASALGGMVPGQTETNISLYSAFTESISARLGIYNVFNRDLYSPSGNEHQLNKIPDRERAIRAECTYQW